jgi:uncharacterized protein
MKRTVHTRSPRAAIVIAAAALLGGCASAPPPRFHTLMPAPTTTATPVTPTGPFAWEVLPVAIPAQADQPQWVVRSADGSLAVLEQERWIAPLADELRAALVARLTSMLGAPVPASAAVSQRIWRVRVDVQRFESTPWSEARLEATWTLRSDEPAGGVLSCHAVLVQAPVAANYPSLARAHQQGVAQLAESIGTALKALGKGQGGACP